MARRFRRTLTLAIRTVTVATVIAASGTTVVYLAANRHTALLPSGSATENHATVGSYRFDRLAAPARTVVRDGDGAIVGTFTDGARNAVLTGPSRTFRQPGGTPAVITTSTWVRLLPGPWHDGAERESWFAPWLKSAITDRSDDVLAIATEYSDGTPAMKDAKAVRFRGKAGFPQTDRPADFLDYLGTAWTFPDGTTENPHPDRYGAVDSAGFVRLVYGYRLGYPLRGDDGRGGGLPRQAAAMAGAGASIIRDHQTTPADRLLLLPGDLLFFNDRTSGAGGVDHVGIFLGLDDGGAPRFVSSRKKAGGPTFGDVGPSTLLAQGDRFGQGLRSAVRL